MINTIMFWECIGGNCYLYLIIDKTRDKKLKFTLSYNLYNL